jgi:hypothetical protein
MNTNRVTNIVSVVKKRTTTVSGLRDSNRLDTLTSQARYTSENIRAREREKTAAAIKNGCDLLAMETELGNDLFRTWFLPQCGMKEDLARKYMRLAMYFINMSLVPDLPLEDLYKIIAPSTPESVMTAVNEYLKCGRRLPTDEVDRLITEARQAKSRLRKAEQRAKTAEKTADKAVREAKSTLR